MDRLEAIQHIPILGYKRIPARNNATIPIILKGIVDNTALATKQLAPIAQHFAGKNHRETYYKIWKWLRDNIPYRADNEKVQQLRLPSQFLRKGGDCKSYSLFVKGVLNNLNIPSGYRLVWYYPDAPGETHIYINTADGYTIDPTIPDFNQESEFVKKKTSCQERVLK